MSAGFRKFRHMTGKHRPGVSGARIFLLTAANGMNIHYSSMDQKEPGKQRGDKREAILDAALELFAERGFHGTVVPDVAERAGVGAGTLYRYFESKEALVNALFQQWKGVLMNTLLHEFPVGAAPRQQFHEFWKRLGCFVAKHPRAFAFLELHHHTPYLSEESRCLEESGLRLLLSFVEQAQANQVMKRVPARVLMSLVYGAFAGLVRGALHGYLELTPEVLETAEQVMWEAIRV